jgi:adenosylcobinamide-phosphate synthase
MLPPDTLPVLALALLVESAAGYPGRLYTLIGHPVTWMGAAVAGLDRTLNRSAWTFERRRASGAFALAILLTGTALAALAVGAVLAPLGLAGTALLAILASSLLAQRSLHAHVAAVAEALTKGGLAEGRRAVSMIVGRNPETLDEAGVCRAAIESLAENFSDGIVAPAVWLGAGGLAGGALYKAANTADSMIGHRTPRHEAFGWAAARFDDIVNLPASRLSAGLIVAAATLLPGTSPGGAWRAARRDARHHRSPNAGWPEAAMAGALGLALAGPRVYGSVRFDDRWIGNGRAEATAQDIMRALALYRIACALLLALVLALTGLVWLVAR